MNGTNRANLSKSLFSSGYIILTVSEPGNFDSQGVKSARVLTRRFYMKE